MKKKFKIMYGENSIHVDKRGKPYIAPKGCMVVMSNQGVFFHIDTSDPYMVVVKELWKVVDKYDVVWK